MDILGTYSNLRAGEIPVLALISDAQRRRTPSVNRNKQALQNGTRRLSEDEITRLVDAYEQGESVYQLGRRFGIHRTTVSAHLRRTSIQTRVVR